jgi:hypothetical protein
MAELFDFKVYNNDCHKIPTFGPFQFLPLIEQQLMFYYHSIKQKTFQNKLNNLRYFMHLLKITKGFHRKPQTKTQKGQYKMRPKI